MSLNRCFCSSFFFTKVGWEDWNDFETLIENGRNIFQTTVAYIYHLGKSTKFNQKLKNKTYSFQRKNRNTKLNSLSFTANTIEYSYSAIIGFSNIYILPTYRFLVWTGFLCRQDSPRPHPLVMVLQICSHVVSSKNSLEPLNLLFRWPSGHRTFLSFRTYRSQAHSPNTNTVINSRVATAIWTLFGWVIGWVDECWSMEVGTVSELAVFWNRNPFARNRIHVHIPQYLGLWRQDGEHFAFLLRRMCFPIFHAEIIYSYQYNTQGRG